MRQSWHICSSAETAAATIQGHEITFIQRVLSTSKPPQLSHCVYLALQLYCRSKFAMNQVSMLPERTDGVSFSALPCTEKLKHICGAIIIPPSTYTFSAAVPLQIKNFFGCTCLHLLPRLLNHNTRTNHKSYAKDCLQWRYSP